MTLSMPMMRRALDACKDVSVVSAQTCNAASSAHTLRRANDAQRHVRDASLNVRRTLCQHCMRHWRCLRSFKWVLARKSNTTKCQGLQTRGRAHEVQLLP